MGLHFHRSNYIIKEDIWDRVRCAELGPSKELPPQFNEMPGLLEREQYGLKR